MVTSSRRCQHYIMPKLAKGSSVHETTDEVSCVSVQTCRPPPPLRSTHDHCQVLSRVPGGFGLPAVVLALSHCLPSQDGCKSSDPLAVSVHTSGVQDKGPPPAAGNGFRSGAFASSHFLALRCPPAKLQLHTVSAVANHRKKNSLAHKARHAPQP